MEGSRPSLQPVTRSLIRRQGECQREAGLLIRAEYGSFENYMTKLELIDIDQPQSPLLIDFYSLYERNFPLAEEREPLLGFDTVLAFNKNAQVQTSFGPLYEAITIVRECGGQTVIAAVNYTVMSFPGDQRAVLGFDGSCHLNFICVDKMLRGVGVATALLDYVETRVAAVVAKETGAAAPRVFITCELNNPVRMTAEQIETDAAAALICPLERQHWWSQRGFDRLDFAYEQPPLSAWHKPCTYVDLYVHVPTGPNFNGRSMQTAPLVEHLRRFFFGCVGKFQVDMMRNEQWLRQKRDLEMLDRVRVHQSNFVQGHRRMSLTALPSAPKTSAARIGAADRSNT